MNFLEDRGIPFVTVRKSLHPVLEAQVGEPELELELELAFKVGDTERALEYLDAVVRGIREQLDLPARVGEQP